MAPTAFIGGRGGQGRGDLDDAVSSDPFTLAGPHCGGDTPHQRHAAACDEHLRHGRPAEALVEARSAAVCRPRWPPAHVAVAQCHVALGHVQRALDSYARAVELDPSLLASTSEAVAALDLRLAAKRCRAVLGGAGQPAIYDAAVMQQVGARAARVATAGGDGAVSVWCCATGALLQLLRGHTQAATVLAWSPCGTFLASGSLDRDARLWRRSSSAGDATAPHQPPPHLQPHAVLRGHVGRVSGLAFSPDSSALATASPDGSVRVWSTGGGACLHELSAHSALVTAISFSPCGALLASASGDAVFNVWEARSGRSGQSVAWESGPVVLCGFLPAAAGLLLTAHAQLAREEGRVLLWDVVGRASGWVDGRLVAPCKTIDGLRGRPTSWDACLGPDGASLLAVACGDGAVCVWDISAAPLPLYSFHLDDVRAGGGGGGGAADAPAWRATSLREAAHMHNLVAFSPGGGLVAASGGAAHAIVVLEADSGQRVQALAGHSGAVRALRWVGDGGLLTASEDGTARVWDVGGSGGAE